MRTHPRFAFSPIAQEMIGRMLTSAPATIRAEVEALARRVGIDA